MENPFVIRAYKSKEFFCDKELLAESTTKEGTFYFVNDVFFSRWLEREY